MGILSNILKMKFIGAVIFVFAALSLVSVSAMEGDVEMFEIIQQFTRKEIFEESNVTEIEKLGNDAGGRAEESFVVGSEEEYDEGLAQTMYNEPVSLEKLKWKLSQVEMDLDDLTELKRLAEAFEKKGPLWRDTCGDFDAMEVTKAELEKRIAALEKPNLPPKWSEHVDPDSGRTFYYNAKAKASQWEYPNPKLSDYVIGE